MDTIRDMDPELALDNDERQMLINILSVPKFANHPKPTDETLENFTLAYALKLTLNVAMALTAATQQLVDDLEDDADCVAEPELSAMH